MHIQVPCRPSLCHCNPGAQDSMCQPTDAAFATSAGEVSVCMAPPLNSEDAKKACERQTRQSWYLRQPQVPDLVSAVLLQLSAQAQLHPVGGLEQQQMPLRPPLPLEKQQQVLCCWKEPWTSPQVQTWTQPQRVLLPGSAWGLYDSARRRQLQGGCQLPLRKWG